MSTASEDGMLGVGSVSGTWQWLVNPEGTSYFFNNATNECVWEKPACFMTASEIEQVRDVDTRTRILTHLAPPWPDAILLPTFALTLACTAGSCHMIRRLGSTCGARTRPMPLCPPAFCSAWYEGVIWLCCEQGSTMSHRCGSAWVRGMLVHYSAERGVLLTSNLWPLQVGGNGAALSVEMVLPDGSRLPATVAEKDCTPITNMVGHRTGGGHLICVRRA